jgi:methylated-DNA-[protein]-cysteine S-methyltransferase
VTEHVFQGLMTSYCVFETAIGFGGIAWGPTGVVGTQLPEASETSVRQRLRRRFPGAGEASPSALVRDAISKMSALLRGEAADLSDVELDMERVPERSRQVYEIARTIPPGRTMTYGQIASRLGEDPRIAIEVGQALARNPFPIVVPCHRVLAANGKLGGFSAAGGVATKQRLLAIEQANVAWQPSLL